MSLALLMRYLKLSMSSKHLSVKSSQSKLVHVISDSPGSRLVLILLTCGVNNRFRSGVIMPIADLYLSRIILTVS